VERFFGSLKRRTSAFFKGINAGRSRIASLDGMMNMFFVYYNGPRSQEGMGRAPSEDPLIWPTSSKRVKRFIMINNITK